jgi:SAM-dependent methyltransferase
LPDDLLLHLVVHSVDPEGFLQSGKEAAELLLEVLDAHGARSRVRRVLDLGVGCGRVARWWKELGVDFELHGSDINEQLVAWCRENIDSGTFQVNPLHPPTQYADEQFDLVYAFSVFTHLTADTQREWRDELRRIVAPGGYVVLTTHGDGHAAGLAEPSQEDYARDGFVVVSRQAEGENLCATYQTRDWTERLLGDAFDVVEFRPSVHAACGNQDLYLLRKPGGKAG